MTPPIVPPTGPMPPNDRFARPTAPAVGTGFAQVFDLAAERARRAEAAPPIPASVLDEMGAAARVLDALDAQGHELRFDLVGGKVRAELRTADGTVVRQVPLAEAIEVGG